jgi:hypothetical protein
VDDFLCSYRSFAQPQELLDFLINRYNLPPPPVAKDMELSISQSAAEVSTSMSSGSSSSHLLYDKYLPLLQLRVLNVMRKWLANHFYDFEDDPRLLARMLNFVENTLRVHQPNEQHYEAIKSLVLEQVLPHPRLECFTPVERPVACAQSTAHSFFRQRQAREVLVDKNSPLSEILVVMERDDMGVATQIFHKKGKKYVRSFNGTHTRVALSFVDQSLISFFLLLLMTLGHQLPCANCAGMDFVDWCRDKLGMDSTAEAIALGNKMIQQNIIRSLEKRDRRSVFKVASDLFYRFSRGVPPSPPLSSPQSTPTHSRSRFSPSLSLSLLSLHSSGPVGVQSAHSAHSQPYPDGGQAGDDGHRRHRTRATVHALLRVPLPVRAPVVLAPRAHKACSFF